MYVADFGNDRFRAISARGVVTTYADVQGPMALAIGPQGTLYVAGNGGVQAIGADGSITTILSQTGGLTPDAIAASPTGVLYISNFSAKDLLEYSGGVLTVIGQVQGTYVTPAGLAVSPNGDLYVGNYGSFAIDRLVGHSLSPLATFALNSVPGVKGVFRPSGVAVTPNGEVYADTDGVNGGASQPALIAIDPDGQVHLLASRWNRQRSVDLFRTGMSGLRARRLRAALSARSDPRTEPMVPLREAAGSHSISGASIPCLRAAT